MLLGGDGDDLLVGGTGRDFLFAGAGADGVIGNADDDILIAGATAYDDRQALALLRGVWIDSVASYEQRVAALRSSATLPGGIRLGADTVYHDASADVLTGASGEDWFLFDPTWDRATDINDEVFDPDSDFFWNS